MTSDVTAEREAIRDAMHRLLAGTPTRSTEALTVLQLAAEAGVKRWILTHKHTDLKDEFDRRKQEANGVPPAFQALHARAVDAEAANATLRTENYQLRARVEVYVQVIHELTTELNRRPDPVHHNIHMLTPGRSPTCTWPDSNPQGSSELSADRANAPHGAARFVTLTGYEGPRGIPITGMIGTLVNVTDDPRPSADASGLRLLA
ncbi:MAG: hypothetical protein ACRDQ7_07265 [Haloechinothrix sp.]